MLKTYYQLTKPGIIYGNAITAIAGFFLASKGQIHWLLLLAMLVGISLIIASGCVFNNLLDRNIDNRMVRTRNRAMVTGVISSNYAIIYGTVLGLAGSGVLYFYTNLLTLSVALIGFVVYVGIYTPMKPRSMHATLVGSIAGSVPPVVGYTAVTNRFDLGALLLFLILVTWQMPHFYAIAIRRLDEYRSAGIPVLPVKKGIRFTKVNMLVYIIVFTIIASLLTVFKFMGFIYLAVVILLGIIWLTFAIQGFQKGIQDRLWARKMFLFSLVVLTVISITISISATIYK